MARTLRRERAVPLHLQRTVMVMWAGSFLALAAPTFAQGSRLGHSEHGPRQSEHGPWQSEHGSRSVGGHEETHGRWGGLAAWWRSSGPSRSIGWGPPRERRLPGRVVESPTGFGVERHPVRVAVLGRGSTDGVPWRVVNHVERFGREVAHRHWPLVTGGGRGLPRKAEKHASRNGGETWAVSAVRDVDEQMRAFDDDLSTTSVLYPTATGSGAGTIEREATLVQSANIRAYFNGGPGTFGEVIAGLHEPGVLAFLEDAGGVSSAARTTILPFIGVPENVRIVAAEDPERLLSRAHEALQGLHQAGVRTTPEHLFRPPAHVAVIPREKAQRHNVFAFLVNDNGVSSAADREATVRMVDLALTSRISGRTPIAVGAAAPRGLMAEVLVRATRDHNTEAIGVSTAAGRDMLWKPHNSERTFLVKHTGNGDGVGEFAMHREIVDQADVIFISSAYFKNLSGLAFALRDAGNPIIAVLEQESTGSDRLRDILHAVNDGPLSESRFVFSRDPQELMAKVERRLLARRAPPPRAVRDRPSEGGRIPVTVSRGPETGRPAYMNDPRYRKDPTRMKPRNARKWWNWYHSPQGPGGALRRESAHTGNAPPPRPPESSPPIPGPPSRESPLSWDDSDTTDVD